jgi:hypothetical protein
MEIRIMQMKSTLTLLAAMVLAVPSAALAQQFEGVIKQRTISIEEILSVDQQPVSDDLFTAPAGYRKMTMEDMMRGG